MTIECLFNFNTDNSGIVILPMKAKRRLLLFADVKKCKSKKIKENKRKTKKIKEKRRNGK